MRGDGSGRRLRTAGHAFAASARNPAVRRIQLGFAGACTAEWTFTVVLSVYAFQQGGAEAVGLVSLVRMLPSALLAPFASAPADRWRRDLVLTLVSVTRCATAVGIAVIVAAGGSAIAVYGLAILSTAAALLYRPVNSALLPLLCHTPTELASGERRPRAARLHLDPGRDRRSRPALLADRQPVGRLLRGGRARRAVGRRHPRPQGGGARAARGPRLGGPRPAPGRAGRRPARRRCGCCSTLLAAQV